MSDKYREHMKLGYARISTKDQNFELQEDALKKSGCEKIYKDVASGAKQGRLNLSVFKITHPLV